MIKTLKIHAYGTVQGVFFRKFVFDNAQKLEIHGFVRNLDNGSVEIVVEGHDDKIKEMLEICRKGPPHSRVDELEVQEIQHQGFKEFKIMRI
jgi:acylphosphatase